MRIARTLAWCSTGLLVLALAGCGKDPGTPMPVVKIRPWKPPAPGNPLVLSVDVSGKGAYSFLDSDPGLGHSHLVVIARDGSNLVLGTVAQDLAVKAWNDGLQLIKLTDDQVDLTKNPNMKSLIFRLVVICQNGAAPPQKIEDTATFP